MAWASTNCSRTTKAVFEPQPIVLPPHDNYACYFPRMEICRQTGLLLEAFALPRNAARDQRAWEVDTLRCRINTRGDAM